MGEREEEAGCMLLALWLTCLGCLARAAGDRVTREALGFQMELSKGQLPSTGERPGGGCNHGMELGLEAEGERDRPGCGWS